MPTFTDSGSTPAAIDVVYLVVGKVTGRLAALGPGEQLDVWGPLGNGFAVPAAERLLLVAGGKDHIAPASVTKTNFNLYKKSKAVTDYKEFPERSHFTLGQAGWEEVADYALDWAVAHAGERAPAVVTR